MLSFDETSQRVGGRSWSLQVQVEPLWITMQQCPIAAKSQWATPPKVSPGTRTSGQMALGRNSRLDDCTVLLHFPATVRLEVDAS